MSKEQLLCVRTCFDWAASSTEVWSHVEERAYDGVGEVLVA